MAMAASPLLSSSLQFLYLFGPLSPLHISAASSTKITSVGFPAISLSIRKSFISCIRDTTRGRYVEQTKFYGISQNYGHALSFQDKRKRRCINVSERTSDLTEAGKREKSSHERSVDEDEVASSRFWNEEDGSDHSSDSTSSPASSISGASSVSDSLSLAIKEPIYEVIEVKPNGVTLKKDISRRQLLKSSGLRLRDIRSVDPSLWVTNSMPSILVRGQAILLNLGSLRAITLADNVLVFDHRSKGGQAFLKALLPRLNPKNNNGAPTMSFELEVVEAALISRTQRLERKLMEVEPRVAILLEMLPNRLTADTLEQLRLSKQALVELASRAGALRQMLLELLEDSNAIRRMTVIGRCCVVRKQDGLVECSIPSDKQVAEEEEEEIEMLLDNYLQRCESCHGQAERLLDTAKEMEDSIAVSLSSRRLEVSRLELLLQVGTFCTALGALVSGIFGMNLKSYLEEHVFAFWLTTAGIIFGAMALFVLMYSYLKKRKIL